MKGCIPQSAEQLPSPLFVSEPVAHCTLQLKHKLQRDRTLEPRDPGSENEQYAHVKW